MDVEFRRLDRFHGVNNQEFDSHYLMVINLKKCKEIYIIACNNNYTLYSLCLYTFTCSRAAIFYRYMNKITIRQQNLHEKYTAHGRQTMQ